MAKDTSNIDSVTLKEKEHSRKKSDIGGRVQVLRVLIRNYYYDKREKYTEYDFIRHCEAVLDNMLAKYTYNIEGIIDMWRTLKSKLKKTPIICGDCGYRPPFCGCEVKDNT
jgi:hypothetical protein